MIDLEYFAKPLCTNGHDSILFIDPNEVDDHHFHTQGHKVAFKMDHGFHVDGKIDGSLRTFMEDCGLENIIATKHGLDVPKTHSRGSIQIDFALTTPRLREFVKDCGLLVSETLCNSDHRGIFMYLAIEGVFGAPPEHLRPAHYRKLKLDNPRISDAYRCALHKKFEQHNVDSKVKEMRNGI
jgi:hypothetical protein